MEQTLAYMDSQKRFLEESVQEFTSRIAQITQYQMLYERKFASYERGDNNAFLAKDNRIFGISISELIRREGIHQFLNTSNE